MTIYISPGRSGGECFSTRGHLGAITGPSLAPWRLWLHFGSSWGGIWASFGAFGRNFGDFSRFGRAFRVVLGGSGFISGVRGEASGRLLMASGGHL